jgi:hypothetical protein
MTLLVPSENKRYASVTLDRTLLEIRSLRRRETLRFVSINPGRLTVRGLAKGARDLTRFDTWERELPAMLSSTRWWLSRRQSSSTNDSVGRYTARHFLPV